VVNLGIEGCMLAGALGAFAVGARTGSPFIGVLGGIAAGAACGLLHAWMAVIQRADQLASGLVVWFLALGVTSVFGTSYIGQDATTLPVLAIPGLSNIPIIGPILFQHNILVYLGYALVPMVWFVLFRTQLGLVLRATGERPEVVAAAGWRPKLVQVLAVTFGAALAGGGGAQLSVGYVGNWSSDMTSGYGFIAVAMVMCGAWRPGLVLLGSYLFGLSLAAASVLQSQGVGVNQYLLDALPYLVTMVVLVVFARRRRSSTPEGLSRALTHVT
jgi:simple sugar transport system permease protein